MKTNPKKTTTQKAPQLLINRIAWISFFISGSILFYIMEDNPQQSSYIGFFLGTSLWSAVCGIGYSITDWLISK